MSFWVEGPQRWQVCATEGKRTTTTYRAGGDVATGNNEYEVRAFRLPMPRTKVECFMDTNDLSD